MSTLEARTIEPQSGTTVTLGASGDSVVIGADALKTNTIKDAGGNTIFTSDGAGTLSSINSSLSGNMVYINKATASGSTSLTFSSGIDSTYDEYVFCFVNIHPATDNAALSFQVNAVGGSDFDETMTTTFFNASHYENDSSSSLNYVADSDQSGGTAYQKLGYGIHNGSDGCGSGILHLFAPGSTTYVKHFYSRFNEMYNGPLSGDRYVAGYINTASAIDEIDFKMTSGNMDAGTIYLYGIK